jgi:5-methylcytosine-specific restriction protein A
MNTRKLRLNNNERFLLLKLQGNCCCLCKQRIYDIYDVDHIQPLCFQGQDTIQNLQALCLECHRRKTTYEMQHLHHNECYCKQCDVIFSRHFFRQHLH